MSQTTVNLGYVPKNRGEYSSTAPYYKDNIVQYNGSSYICNPPNYDPDTAPTASITGVAPYASDPAVPNTGWAVFANDASGMGEGVYNVSVDHTTDNQPKKYADLSAALQDVPQAKQKGGMTIRFIQSSDNKYVQFRLMSDEWSTNTEDWAIADDGVYVENPEFAEVHTDAENKILYGVKQDGDFYFGAGVPSQIQEELDNKVKVAAANKVDKEEGKSLIDSEYASTKSTIDNSEFLKVTTDSEDKVLEGTRVDGTKVIGGDLNVGGSASIGKNLKVTEGLETSQISVQGNDIAPIENPAYVEMTLDNSGKIIEAVNQEGQFNFPGGVKTSDIEISGNISSDEQSDSFVELHTDKTDRILYGVKRDGDFYFGAGCPKQIVDYINSKEEQTKETVYINANYTISAGGYRNTSIRMPALEREEFGKVTITGINGVIIFSDSYWRGVVKYVLEDGKEKEILIPKDTPNIIITTINNEPVTVSTSFHLVLKGYVYKDQIALIQSIEKFNKYLPIMANMVFTIPEPDDNVPSTLYKTLVLASITDIHNDAKSLKNILSLTSFYNAYMQDVIALGDYVNGAVDAPYSLNNVAGWNNVLKAIGNHDAYDSWPTPQTISEKDCYDLWMKDDIANWGVEYTSDKTYFYKDYPMTNMRVIFLDYMHWDDTNDADGQIAWLEDILYGDNNYSALANGYHVVICLHSLPKSENSGALVPLECNFNYIDAVSDRTDNICTLPDIVNTFMEQGGIFACYLCGHRHRTFFGTYENYPNQIYISQPNAFNNPPRDSAYIPTTDCELNFYILSFDYRLQFIRIYKPGNTFDHNLRHMESALLQYGSGAKLISSY